MSQFHFSIRTPAKGVRGLGSAKSGTEHFWRQRVTAVAMVPLALAFVAIVICASTRDYESARALIANPFVAILLLLFVVTGAVHGKLGVQIVIEDYIHHEGLKVAAVIANILFTVVVAVAAVFAVLKISFGV
ncbi:succinate dehydrogenase, hydrophobic membrane anchor protein [Pseudochelatococcus contaminans]|uniref:Succinate dehydrogenase hydrophobic membrane anchor subunit n=1 Tax=Pseudochelatococcus contaminans TaxID=1538103 RepID=A0A7W5Z490_9HYPH|nr:succinate dehydrogenase, hydrophobic membrane anchor protein [Pseudochelatococcus contaminans]MBB3809550.1 succinate dehydrogenase / fumarate reductase membrane anchor subunit [Pseudochelatococcus contaminans]